MKKHTAGTISIPFLVLSMVGVGTTTVPYMIGRFVRLHQMLRSRKGSTVSSSTRVQEPINPATVTNGRYATDGTSVVQNAEARNETHTAVLSGSCQSLGIDMDELDPEFLQSSKRMEEVLSKIMAHDTFGPPDLPVLREPRCEDPRLFPERPESSTNHQRLHCDALFANAYLHIYTWPQSGTISIDIFSCTTTGSEESLMSLIPKIRDVVGIQASSKTLEKSKVRWYYKLRGDRSDDGHSTHMNGDMDHFLCSYIDFDVKELIVSIDTEYQTIDIYDTIDPRFRTREQYYASLRKDDGTYYSKHPELFRPNRIIYLDGISQSRYYGDAAYHEPLVHPALFTHPNPKRVAIIGGGEGATLREVLKHNTIETVTMIEIDELMVNVSMQYIPEWSNCSMIAGSTPSCFDDPRAEVFYTDGIAWFIHRYLNADAIDDALRYDVVIMDALDPESSTDFSTVLYNTDDFMKSLSNSLRFDGILISQLGENFMDGDPGLHYSVKKVEYDFMQNLIEYGFDRMEDYTEAHGGFLSVWKYKILFKCKECTYSRWHNNQAMVELEMKKRSMTCINDCNLFKYFDGATMMEYQYVSRVNEAIFCLDTPQKLPDRKELWCENRHGYDPELNHIHLHSLRNSTLFDTAGMVEGNADLIGITSPLTTNFSYIGLDVSAQSIVILPATTNILRLMANTSRSVNIVDGHSTANKRWDLLLSLSERFGVPCIYWGSSCYFISLPFLLMSTNEQTQTAFKIDDSFGIVAEETLTNISTLLDSVVYNPFISRNHFNFQWMYDRMAVKWLAVRM